MVDMPVCKMKNLNHAYGHYRQYFPTRTSAQNPGIYYAERVHLIIQV